MLTENKHFSICAMIDEKMTRCRMFWSFMYTIFFTTAWLSFYSTELCTQLMTKYVVGTMSIYVATGFVVYWLLFLIVPLTTHLMHQITKERVKSLKTVCGAKLVGALCQFFMFITFPIFSGIVKRASIAQGAALWSWMGLVGSVICLIEFYINPDDYGLDDAFYSLCLGVLFSLDGIIGRTIVFSFTRVSNMISRDRKRAIKAAQKQEKEKEKKKKKKNKKKKNNNNKKGTSQKVDEMPKAISKSKSA